MKMCDPATMQKIKDHFAWIAMNANAARSGDLSTMDALCYIERDWKLIEELMLSIKMVDA